MIEKLANIFAVDEPERKFDGMTDSAQKLYLCLYYFSRVVVNILKVLALAIISEKIVEVSGVTSILNP